MLAHVRVRTGHDFSQYKRATVLAPHCAPHAGDRGEDSRRITTKYLRENAEEAQALSRRSS